jgi:hypothetical protein
MSLVVSILNQHPHYLFLFLRLLQVAVPFSFLCYVSEEVSLRLIQEHRKQKLDKEKAKWNEEILT